MVEYRKPGVYVKEITNLPASVSPVATAIPAFIGYTQKREKNGTIIENRTPVKISSLVEYEEIFGDAFKEHLVVALSGKSLEPTDTIIRVGAKHNLSPYNLYYHLAMFFANGGGACYIVSVGLYTTEDIPAQASSLIKKDDLLAGLEAVEKVGEITILVVPEAIHLLDFERTQIYDQMLVQCAKLKNRFAIFDVLAETGTVKNDADKFRNNVGALNLKYGASYYPSLKTMLSLEFEDKAVSIQDNRIGGVYHEGDTLENVRNGEFSNINLYNLILQAIQQKYEVILYPSAAVAGVYAKVDSQRGVWKAPANVGLLNVREPSVQITNSQQGYLNTDVTAGKSINAIRSFSGKGILVWGARTLAGNDNEWRYVSVRRFYNFVEESVTKSTRFAVFEPNNANTWIKVKTMIDNFLNGLWRQGALQGVKPEQAWFVKVGLGETMTAQDISNGRLIVEIGMAVVRPAEFIVLRFFHQMQ